MSFKRGTKLNPIITISKHAKSGQIFQRTYNNYLRWIKQNNFKSGTIHHVYTDYGRDNVNYFIATKR
jgi:hypothetical protein